MTETFLETYFEGLATKTKAIGHTPDTPAFYRIKDSFNLEEFDNALRNIKKPTCLLLEIGAGQIGATDNPMDHPRIGLHVVTRTGKKFADVNAARDQAKTVLLQLVALIKLDCQDNYYRQTILGVDSIGPLKSQNVIFDADIKFDNVSFDEDNWSGKCFYFTFSAPVNIAYNPDNYIN